MVVCRYFQEGRCRYGDRCFNEHILVESQRYPNNRYVSSNRFVISNPPRRTLLSSPADKTYSSPNRTWYSNSSNRAWNSNYVDSRNSSPRNQRHYYESDPYTWHASEYDYTHYARDLGSNKFYEPPRMSPMHPSKNKFEVLRNVHEDKNNLENSTSDNTESLALSAMKEDAIFWEKGNMWPFSCYGPVKNRPGLPGLEDISPEEMRHEAYEAKKENAFSVYVKCVAEALEAVKRKRELLKKPTQEIINYVCSLMNMKDTSEDGKCSDVNHVRTGESLLPMPPSLFGSSSSDFFALGHSLSGRTESPKVEQINENVSSFFTKPTSEASSFKFVLPDKTGNKTSSGSDLNSAQEVHIYTLIEDLTMEELEAFSSPTFTLGKIPTRPPAKSMCF